MFHAVGHRAEQPRGPFMRRSRKTMQAIEDIRHKVPDEVVASRYGMFPSQIKEIKQRIDMYGGYEEGPDF